MFYDGICFLCSHNTCMFCFSHIVSCFLSSSQGPLRRFLIECSSSYLANPTCLMVTRKIIPGPFVFDVNKNNTYFFLIIVGFTLVPESEMKRYIYTCVYMLCVYSRGQSTRQRKCPQWNIYSCTVQQNQSKWLA